MKAETKYLPRLALIAALGSLLFLSAFFSPLHSASKTTKPNILFIAVDDLRPELGCYGVDAIHSPNIDALAASGIRFDRAYCQLAVCNPSRVSVMTGLRPDSSKVWTLDVRFRHTVPDVVTLPQHFKSNGYTAVSFGKIFHNPWPDNQSWSEPHRWPERSGLWSENGKKRLADYREQMRADGKSDAAIQRMRAPATEIVDVPDHEHIDGAIAQQAITAMRRLAKEDNPFFLATGFIRPHLPFVVPRKYWDLYDREAIPLAANTTLPKNYPSNVPAMNTMYELRDYMDYADTPAAGDGLLTVAQQRELKHGYYASVSLIDAQVGLLLDELDALGLSENTVVVLWSDHGWKLGEHGSWCKQTNYEIDTRVPLIIRSPAHERIRREAESGSSVTLAENLVELLDLYPTLCDLAGITPPDHVEGRSLVPLLEDPARHWPHAAFSQFYRRRDDSHYMGYAMRTDRYRYVDWKDRVTNETVAEELYDHRSDPDETTNIAPEAANNGLLARLNEKLWSALPAPPDYEARQIALSKKTSAASAPSAVKNSSAKRPNILFLMADDWSWPHAGALGDPVVKTPTFDRVAREGVLFENAFVSAPSCTPSRFAVASGQYHWRLQDGANLWGSLPAETQVYPEMLEAAGYRIGFSGKGGQPSRHKHRGRDPFGERFQDFDEFLAGGASGQPFCFWFGSGDPHRPYETDSGVASGMDPKKVVVPAGLPDNETVRKDICDYYREVERFDRNSGKLLARLEKTGELENTIVVVSGDNGMPFPRCKATLYDTGTRVPLAIRWGDHIESGRAVTDFVSLCDLAPTFLEAAGLPPAAPMTGKSLLPVLTSGKPGQVDPSRNRVLTGLEHHVYSHPARAIRNEDFLYVLNIEPETWINDRGEWASREEDFSYAIDPGPTKWFMTDHRDDPGVAKLYALAFGPRPEEELYDLRNDPGQLRNVARKASFAEAKQRLREQLVSELIATGDPRFATAGYTTRTIEGWTVHVSEELLEKEKEATARALELLREQCRKVADALPAGKLKFLQSVPVWMSATPADGKHRGEYHPDAAWLRDHGYNPAKAKAIEFSNIPIFEKEIIRMPVLLLHELAHAYHDQVLGYDHPEIAAAYRRAVRGGTYDSVARTGYEPQKAYAMENPMEYFAETTEAYFGANDFFPFNRADLKEHDPEMFALLERIWLIERERETSGESTLSR